MSRYRPPTNSRPSFRRSRAHHPGAENVVVEVPLCGRKGDGSGPRLPRRRVVGGIVLFAFGLNDNLEHGKAIVEAEASDTTFAEHLDRYLRVHAAAVQPATIRTLQERLGVVRGERKSRATRSYKTAVEEFGDVKLARA
jgi:hypothetical protein